MADVKITIDIDADTAAIDRVRAKLRALCREVDDCTETHKKHTTALDDLSRAQDREGRSSDNNRKKKSKMLKSVDGLLKGLRKLTMLGFKYLAIEGAAAAVVLASIGPLFKLGSWLAKGYQAALSGVSYALAAVVAGAAAFMAAQRQFQAVQFAPAFSEGAINTTNKFAAASGAMKMFVDDAEMAVIGTKGLSAAFKTLNDQQAVTGKTTAVFRALSNYTAGMGGDMEKGSQSMAKFLSQFQKDKTMTDKVTTAGKELGPQFEKILKEAKKKGLSTYDKFAEAAMKGELGDTFAKYAGQLDAVNNTVIGKFKQAFAGIKSMFVEMGEPLLGPITKTIPKITNIIEALLLRIRNNVQVIGSGSLLDGLVNVFDKVANIVGNLVTRDLSKVGGLVTGMKKGWEVMGKVFEKIQDYLRPLQDASWALWEVLKPIFAGLAGNFNSTLQMLAQSLIDNKDKFLEFTTSIQHLLQDFGSFGAQVKETFIGLLPYISDIIESVGGTYVALEKMVKASSPVLKAFLWTFNKVLQIFNLLINAIDYFFTAVSKVASVVDLIVNPVLDIIKFITFGFLDINNIFQKTAGLIKSIVAALVLATVAFGASAIRNAMGDGATGGGKLFRAGKKFNNFRKARKLAKLAEAGGAAEGGAAAGGAGGGLAAAAVPVAAGLGILAGGVGSGMLGAKLFNKDDSVKSRLGAAAVGAGGGAAIGAAIGSVVPIFGTAAGAIVGGLVGAVTGYLKAGHAKKQARKAADEIIKNYGKGMDDAIKNGDLEALQKAKTEAILATRAQMDKGGLSASEMKKRQKDLEKLNKQVDTYTSNAGNFKMFFGGDADKMNEALELYGKGADSAKNSIINIFKVMRDGGKDVGAAWSTLMGGFNQSILEARLSMFNEQKNTVLETQKAVDAAQRKILEGDTSEKSVTDFLKKAYEYSLLQTGGDATKATALMKDQLDYAYGPGGALTQVSDKIKAGADSLRLFDPQILVDQMIASGKLSTQGRAIETISEGKIGSGVAELQIQRLINGAGENGAAMGSKIDSLMQSYMQGKVTPAQLMGALFAGDAPSAIDSLINTVDQNAAITATRGEYTGSGKGGIGGASRTPTVSSNVPNQGIIVDGVTIQVSGLIKDPGTAQMIAQEVAKAVAAYDSRRGRGGTSAPSTTSGGSDPSPVPTNRQSRPANP